MSLRSRLRSVRLDPYLLLLWLLTSPALAPLLAPGYFYAAHDGRHSVFYLIMFDAAIRDGALWPRWAMHHIQGYGYPTFIIQAPLGFYFAELFVLLGAGYTLAAKLTWAAGFLIGAWGLYCLVRNWLEYEQVEGQPPQSKTLSKSAALVAALLYVYIPYHLSGIYVRGALNDTLLFAWFPWVILAFDRLILYGGSPGWSKRFALAALALAGTLLTHTFALISFAPFLCLFCLFRLIPLWQPPSLRGQNTRAWIERLLLAGGAGVAALLILSAFLLPLLVEGKHLQQQVYISNTYDFRNHFVYWGQFFSPAWGFGFSDDPQGAQDGMGFQLGVMAALFALVAIYLLLMDRDTERRFPAELGYLLVLLVVLLFLMTPAAQPFWESIPLLAVIQFPWRLLALTAFVLSALAGLVVARLSQLQGIHGVDAGLLLAAIWVIAAGMPYVQANLEPVEPWREDGRAIFRFEQEHPDMIAYTEWVEEPFTESPMTADYAAEDYVENYSQEGNLHRLAILSGEGEILSTYSRGSSAGGIVRLSTPATVRVHLYYFPGWRATIDGNPAPIRVSSPHGLIELDVPAGEHQIDVRMGATPARTTGAILAWSTLAVLAALVFMETRQSRASD